MTAAERMARLRERQREGLIVVSIEIDEVNAAEALIDNGWLKRALADDRQELARALGRMVRWITKPRG